MATIEVNHKKLRKLAAAIDDYCDTQDEKMTTVIRDVRSGLTGKWTGLDATEYLANWEDANGSKSNAAAFRDNMRDYRDKLNKCADAYEDAQIDIVNKAKRLSR